MSRYTQIYYHIVFATRDRAPVLLQSGREPLFRHVWGIIRKRKGHLYRINGTLDHVHILTSLHPTVSLADFVKEVKAGSSYWVKRNNLFPDFSHWQDGYGAFTHSSQDKDRLIEYIIRQADHHKSVSFGDELRAMLIEAGVEFDERHLMPEES
jgi:REP element-mobilizing transposase RayT